MCDCDFCNPPRTLYDSHGRVRPPVPIRCVRPCPDGSYAVALLCGTLNGERVFALPRRNAVGMEALAAGVSERLAAPLRALSEEWVLPDRFGGCVGLHLLPDWATDASACTTGARPTSAACCDRALRRRRRVATPVARHPGGAYVDDALYTKLKNRIMKTTPVSKWDDAFVAFLLEDGCVLPTMASCRRVVDRPSHRQCVFVHPAGKTITVEVALTAIARRAQYHGVLEAGDAEDEVDSCWFDA